MLIVKIMSPEDLPDDDTTKAYELIAGVRRVIMPDEEGGVMTLEIEGLSELEGRYPQGNVYVMNEAGRTISTFTASSTLAEPRDHEIHAVIFLNGIANALPDLEDYNVTGEWLRAFFRLPLGTLLMTASPEGRKPIRLDQKILVTDMDHFFSLKVPGGA